MNNNNNVNNNFKELDLLRNQLDVIDDEIISLLVKRFKVVNSVKTFKKDNNVTVLDSNREMAILDRLVSNNPDLDAEFIKNLYSLIFNYSRNLQS